MFLIIMISSAMPLLAMRPLLSLLRPQNAWGLVSSLGGALSLYMGISVILLVEVIEFFIYLVVNSCLYVAGRYDSKTEVRPVTPPSPTPSDVVFVRRLYDALGTKVKVRPLRSPLLCILSSISELYFSQKNGPLSSASLPSRSLSFTNLIIEFHVPLLSNTQ